MMGRTNQDIISDYIDWCSGVKRFSGATIATYFSTLKALRIYLDVNKLHVLSLTSDDMRAYFMALNEREDLQKISINDYRATIKVFFKYLVEQKLIQANPMAKIKGQMQGKPEHDALTMEELDRIISQVDEAGCYLFRDTVMFELFWNSGLRTSELSNLKERHLKLTDVKLTEKDDEGNVIKERVVNVFDVHVVEGKGEKDRIVTVGETTTLLLTKFMQAKKLLYPVTEYVFPSKRGAKINRRQVYGIISNFLNLSTAKKKGAHVLRHTYATMLLNNGVGILHVKELLGHSKVATTQIYAKPSKEMMSREYNKAHPKGDKKLKKKEKPSIGSIKNYRLES